MPKKLRDLTLSEISLVDNPANPGARVVLAKRADPFAKEAQTFDEARDTSERREAWWRMTAALQDSLGSILHDEDLTPEQRAEQMSQSVDQFRDAMVDQFGDDETPDPVAAGSPGTGTQGDDDMDLEKRVGELESQIATLTKERDKARAEVAKLQPPKPIELPADVAKRIEDAEKRAAEAEEMAKAERDRREQAEFTKRADDEFGALPGESVAKGAALRAVSKLDEDEREALTTMLKAGQNALAAFQKENGAAGGDDTTDAHSQLVAKAEDIRKADPKLTKEQAFKRACEDNPDLYNAQVSYQTKRRAA